MWAVGPWGGGFHTSYFSITTAAPLVLGSFAVRILFANLVLVDGVATQG